MPELRSRERLSWTLIGVLVVSCGLLGFLQYRWTGDIARAEREQLRGSLRTRLDAFARALDNEVATAANLLIPDSSSIERLGREEAWRARYSHSPLFTSVIAAWGTATGEQRLLRLEPAGEPAVMPQGAPDTLILQAVGPPPVPQLLIVKLNVAYLRASVLPRLLTLYLGDDGILDYDAEISANARPGEVIYKYGDAGTGQVRLHSDASVHLLDVRLRGGPPRGGPGPGFPPGRRGPRPDSPPPAGRGRGGPPQGLWELSVRHHAGSLDAVVARAQKRNLALSGGVLLLILVTSILLLVSSRRAQKLAALRMEFVAGVSHELRTPLTVIRTAAYNLRDAGLRSRTEHVEKYGKLIEAESTRLENMMEQVLRFASLDAGRPLLSPQPFSLEDAVTEELELRRGDIQSADVVVEERVSGGLPKVSADAGALRHVIRNLIDNALKHGAEGKWLGIRTEAVVEKEGDWVELRIADRGPGIPRDEQKQIFDAFYRGTGALQRQIRGTGLGLSLARTVAERHGGSLRVESDAGGGAEFILRLPA